MRRATSLVALAATLIGCASGAMRATPAMPATSSPAAAAVHAWERPGLGGAVRPEMGSPQPGEVAPDFTLPAADGRSIALSSMRGSWVVLHFTATWCPFCDSEVAHLGEIADEFASRGVKTVIVDVEEKEAIWRPYAAAHVRESVLALHDTSGAATARFAPPRAQPSFEDRAQAVLDGTLVVDPQGIIRVFLLPDSAHFDPTFRALRAEIERLVPEPALAAHAVRPRPITAGARADLAVTLRVAPGYHVMSDRPSAPNYVPTRVDLDAPSGLVVGAPLYPPSASFTLGDTTIATFSGAVDVRVPIDVERDAPIGEQRLRGTVRYQACTASRCLFPATSTFDITVSVLPAR